MEKGKKKDSYWRGDGGTFEGADDEEKAGGQGDRELGHEPLLETVLNTIDDD